MSDETPRTQEPVRPGGVFLVLLVVTAALGAVGLLYWFVLADGENPQEFPVTSAQSTAATTEDATAAETVRRYLEALAAGDIEAAASMGQVSGDPVLLDNTQHMRQRPAQIQVDESNSTDSLVLASYTIDGERIESEFVIDATDDGPRLRESAASVIVELPTEDSLPLLINGIEVPRNTPLAVTPGTYELGTGLRMIEYPSSDTFRIDAPTSRTTLITPQPQFSELGAEAFRAAVRRSLDECFAATTLAPAGCPQQISVEGAVEEDSVQWRVMGNPLDEVEVRLAEDDLTRGEVTLTVRYSVTYRLQGQDTAITQEGEATATASSSVLREQDIAVQWSQ